MPKISVLTAVHNNEMTIQDSISSVLEQSFSDFELIVIDDGSTDSSSQIVSTFDDARIVLLKNERNLGLSAALNKGLAVAHGEYVARHDADDVSSHNRFELQANFLNSNPEVGLLGGQMEVVDEHDRFKYQYRLPTSHGLLAWYLMFDRSFAHPTVMMRKVLLSNVGGYDESLRVSQDHELWTRLVQLTRFCNLTDVLVRYRSSADGPGFLKPQQQLLHRMHSRQKLAAELLDQEIPLTHIRWMDASQKDPCVLSEDQKQITAALIFRLYNAYRRVGILRTEDENDVHPDFIHRLLHVGRCSDVQIQAESSRRLTGIRWALRYPSKAAQKLLGVGNYASVKSPAKIRQKRQSVDGLSIIVLTHERMKSLEKLLQSLLDQQSLSSPELIIFNNFSETQLSSSGTGSLSKLMRQFLNAKIINSDHNWGTSARYAMATLATNEAILFLDDDLYLHDRFFVSEMAEVFRSLPPLDILSCWNELWIEWGNTELKTVSLDFFTSGVNETILTDTIGPGIAMLNRRLLLDHRVMDVAMQRNQNEAIVSDMGFPLMASLVHGSRCHYFPAWNKVSFHDQAHKGAINKVPDRHRELLALFKRLYQSGYRPVLSRIQEFSESEVERITWAAETLPAKVYSW